MERPWWRHLWSVPAAMRAARATIVIPSLLAITYKIVQDPQMALFATFGGFATLLIAGFGGTRKDKLTAHAGLAVVGSVVLVIGTLASGTAWIAALVTIPVAFIIFFSGVVGPNAASGTTAAMFAYVLPIASAGGAATIPSRLEGWWLASAAGTLAVLLLSPPTEGDRLRAAAAGLAGEIADRVRAAADRQPTAAGTMPAAMEKMRAMFTAATYRPSGLATADQALASLVHLLEWAGAQVSDAFDGHIDMTLACQADGDLLRTAAGLYADVNALLSGREATPEFTALERNRARSAEHLRKLSGSAAGEPDARVAAAQAVHAQAIAVAARGAAADALLAAGRARPAEIAADLRAWDDLPATRPVIPNGHRSLTTVPSYLSGAGTAVRRHATVRSVWFVTSLRGALALAAAVAVADVSGVQHGFWVVLGTLSVLRTNATATGATAWRALAGTAVGFAVGAALVLAIGTGQTALWVALPVAVAVAAYAPGTAPFLVGQAAFTVTIVVLFNLLVPVGWTVGLLRVEDVAIGCGVSLVVGVVFWPRGASSVVVGDLADAFRSGAAYLTQAVDWALSELLVPPAAAATALTAGIRLDDALRGFLAEQGSKRAAKEDLWALVTASTRLRLTASTLACLRDAQVAADVPAAAASGGATGDGMPGLACAPLDGSQEYAGTPACTALRETAAGLAGFYGQVADLVAHRSGDLAPVPPPPVTGAAVPRPGSARPESGSFLDHPHLLWVLENLHHLSQSAQSVSGPALRIAEVRRRRDRHGGDRHGGDRHGGDRAARRRSIIASIVSNLDPAPNVSSLQASVVSAVDVLEARKAAIGDGTEVRRLLPQRGLRTIGAWCFLDHYGPDDTSAGAGMQVPPHPHIGLQTASWLFDGLVLHRDSLGSEQLIRPGELNLMTSGRGITHSEQSPERRPPALHGVQLWIALPAGQQHTDPEFTHYAGLPVLTDGPATITVVAGEHGGERSPAKVHTPLVGLEVRLDEPGQITLPGSDGFEYGVLAADGPATVACPALSAPARIEPGRIAHLPVGVPSITLSSDSPARFFVVGGVPLREKLIMWWNFVARTAAEIGEARDAWIAGDSRFGTVRGYPGDPLAAPPLPPGSLRAR